MMAFDYSRPASVAEAVARIRADEDCRALAGGMTLLPTLKQRLTAVAELVDLGGLAQLRGVREEPGCLVIGAMTLHAEVATSPLVRGSIPGLAQLAAGIGDPQVRNRGTLGGSVANNDPAADYPAAVLALDAVIVTDRREIAAADFFLGMFETALERDELIIEIRFPIDGPSAYAKFPNPVSRYAMAGAFVCRGAAGPRVAITGAAPAVFRPRAIEEALARDFSRAALDGLELPVGEMISDLHGTGAYRAHLAKVMTARAVAACA
jgi:carbon-monoxide dehydrogenase medium subunit